MRIRHIAPLAAAAALTAVALLPATASAGAGVDYGPQPADCTEAHPNTRTATLTCTARPAGQQWRVVTLCGGGWFDTDAWGTIVTGNGTSTAVCPAGSMALSGVYFMTV